MFGKKRKREDGELRKLLRESWPADADEERATFLQRLKLVLPPDHPGLLCLPGREKRANGNAADHRGASRWLRENVSAFVAAWAFIIIAVLLTVFGVRYLLYPPGHTPADGSTGGHTPAAIIGEDDTEKEIKDKYIYRFNGFELTDNRKLTIAQLNKEMNELNPAGIQLTITGMKEVENYSEEKVSVTYHIVIYDLEGYWGPPTGGEENGFKPID
jgi:hypothetical protein